MRNKAHRRAFAIVVVCLALSGCIFSGRAVSQLSVPLEPRQNQNPSGADETCTTYGDRASWQIYDEIAAKRKAAISDLIYRWRWQEALDSIRAAQGALDPLDEIFMVGYINLKLGHYADAESLFAILLNEPYDLSECAAIFLALAAYHNGDYKLAFNTAQMPIGFIPGFGDTIVNIRWRSLREDGDKKGALAQLDTLLALGLMNKWWHKYHSAGILIEMGQKDKARGLLREALRAISTNDNWKNLTILVANRLSSMPDLNNDDIKLLALSYYYADSYADAVIWLQKYCETNDIPQLRYFLAVSEIRTNKYKIALEELNNLLRNNRFDRASIWWRIGQCNRKMGKNEKAKEALDSAIAQCPNCANKPYMLKEHLFLSFDMKNMRQFAHDAATLTTMYDGSDEATVMAIWTILGFFASGALDTSAMVARGLRDQFKSSDFADELRYWEARALRDLGDTIASDSVMRYIAGSDRCGLFAWLARAEMQSIILPEPGKFVDIGIPDYESVWRDAKAMLVEEAGHDELVAMPSNSLQRKAEHLARLGFAWLAKPCFRALEREGAFGSGQFKNLEMWKYYYSLQLYQLAGNEAESLWKMYGNRKEILRMMFLAPFPKDVQMACREENIDPYFVYATMHRESRYDPHAHSWANARGLMQFIDGTGKRVAGWLGIERFESDDSYEYKTSISLGARLLSHLLKARNSPYYALAEYNGGDKRMDRWEKNCPDRDDAILCTELFDTRETRLYAKYVMGYYYTYHWLYGNPSE